MLEQPRGDEWRVNCTRIPNAQDGVPDVTQPTIKVGQAYTYEFVADNPGTWVFHCHILSHVTNQGVEPGGMITVLKVV